MPHTVVGAWDLHQNKTDKFALLELKGGKTESTHNKYFGRIKNKAGKGD